MFTYKGEDIAETILRFAREYRVGHIVVGSPEGISPWERLLGKKNIVDRLVKDAGGITVVVVDTQTLPSEKSLLPEPVARVDVCAEVPVPSMLSLTYLLSSENIIIWDEPVLKEEVLNALVKAALREDRQELSHEAARRVWEREKVGSTFFNEGVAFPHARLEGLSGPRLALGLTRYGIVDVRTQQPVELVFLILSPIESPTAQLQMLALASKAAQNRYLLKNLRSAASAESLLQVIREWEMTQE